MRRTTPRPSPSASCTTRRTARPGDGDQAMNCPSRRRRDRHTTVPQCATRRSLMGTILFSDSGEGLYDHEGWLEYRLREPLVLPPPYPGEDPITYVGWTPLYAAGVDELRCEV